MKSLVVFVAALALAAAAPSGEPGLKKRSVGHAVAYTVPTSVLATQVVEPVVYSSPSVYAPAATVYSTGSAVSHQSRVDVRTSPAVVATSPAVVSASPAVVAAAPAVVDARTVYSAPLYAAPAAVSHQSRYDVRSSPALLTEQVVAPAVYNQHLVAAPAVVDARSLWTPSVYATSW
ncbi:PREDICTED: cuticle protein 16.5, isoform A-like [Papilio xuthus]|uniref:Cuticle protein 16.5, isoform A-like n=1 Tax=Papilio xuthus TaxID=66420 RepID=A0AAJ6ZG61_PAPXU